MNDIYALNELYHHGILGQKWGVRRFQNKAGRLTTLGKKRYEQNEIISPRNTNLDKSTRQENAHDDYNKAHDKTKNVKTMSDAELRSRLNRLQMEQQYSTLSATPIKRGQKYVNNVVKVGTTVATVTSAALTIYNNVNRIQQIMNPATKKG